VSERNVWPALYAGVCQECLGHFDAGVLIKPAPGDGYVHSRCPDPLAVTSPPCPDCFLVHPAGACDR
jgi:hypothetical protein